jgi:hypothetical protein
MDLADVFDEEHKASPELSSSHSESEHFKGTFIISNID